MTRMWRQLTSRGALRAGLVLLLVGGAYFASLPWASCAFPLGLKWVPELLRICSFGTGNAAFDRTGPGPLWPHALFAAVYLGAALVVAFSKRIGSRT